MFSQNSDDETIPVRKSNIINARREYEQLKEFYTKPKEPPRGRKSFILAMQRRQQQKQILGKKKKAPKAGVHNSLITDYFQTMKRRRKLSTDFEEPTLSTENENVKILIEGVDQNSMTMDQSESTFDGYNS